MTTERTGRCWKCGKSLSGGEYARSESCPGCDSDTRVCRNCGLYDAKASGGCREPVVEFVSDKTRANFCELFRPGMPEFGGEQDSSSDGVAKSAFDDLFKKKS